MDLQEDINSSIEGCIPRIILSRGPTDVTMQLFIWAFIYEIKNHNGYEVRYTWGYKYYPQPHAIQTKSLMSNQKLSRVFYLVSLKG